MLVPRGRYLDPRDELKASAEPIKDAVNVPLIQLPDRMHELPSRRAAVQVVGPEALASATVDWLRAHGREAVRVTEYEPDPNPVPRRLWDPNPFLMEVLPHLPPGRAADIACGTGRDAVAMAAYGWQVTALDHLEDGLQRGRQLAERYLDQDGRGRIDWQVANVIALPEAIGMGYDLASMFFFLDRGILRLLPDLLNDRGGVVVETFTSVHRERYGKPRREGLVLDLGELPTLLPGFQVRHFSEDWRDDRHTARLWGTKG
jgi:SAM-dependent methyltransferase